MKPKYPLDYRLFYVNLVLYSEQELSRQKGLTEDEIYGELCMFIDSYFDTRTFTPIMNPKVD